MRLPLNFAFSALVWALGACAHAATPQLYPTGPAEDSSFVRFVDALPDALTVETDHGAATTLTPQQRDTTWQAVPARTPLQATLRTAGRREALSVQVEPSEFVTVAVVPHAGKGGWRVVLGREKPKDFSALKVSLGAFNASTRCPSATLKVAERDTVVLSDVSGSSVQRRQINAVPLAISLWCGGQPTGVTVDLGVLRPGQRWTLIIVDDAPMARILPLLDRMP
jgi:hypothetical protein